MRKEEQTDAVKWRLWKLTLQFTCKYKWKYYKQYRGDIEDLAMDFYTQFLTPKARVQGKEETLLDKFDPKITTLEYLVKVSVQRMLIDRSRKDCRNVKSIDKFTDEYGDCILKAFELYSTEDEEDSIDKREITADDRVLLKKKWFELSVYSKKVITDYFEEVKNILAPNYRVVFEDVIYSE